MTGAGRMVAMAGRRGNAGSSTIYMHRVIMCPGPGMVVDHINGDSLDNRRINLRVCLPCENAKNRRVGINNRSGFKGVNWVKSHKQFVAKIGRCRSKDFLGYYRTAIEAANAYDDAAVEHFGEYANLNFPFIYG